MSTLNSTNENGLNVSRVGKSRANSTSPSTNCASRHRRVTRVPLLCVLNINFNVTMLKDNNNNDNYNF